MKPKAEQIKEISDAIVDMAFTHFSHPDTIAKIYGAIREVELEITKRMEAIRRTEDGQSETIKAKDRNITA